MLSRYRSPSGVELPRRSRAAAFNNPVEQFEGAAEFRLQRLRERSGGLGPESMKTSLRVWDGPLAGIAHVAGQFAALEEGPAAEEARQPPGELAKPLSADLELLMALADTAQDIQYDAGGSESDFAVVPIILEPRPSSVSLTPQPPAEATAVSSGAVASGMTGGAGTAGASGGWWSLTEALEAPLTWGEVAASLGLAPELAAQMPTPLELNSPDAFWSHMRERHIRKLAGGEEHERWEPGGTSPSAAAGEAASASAAPSGGSVAAAAEGGEVQPASPAAALAAAVQLLGGAVCFPVLQVMLGSETLGWNPIPLMWLGRAKRSGAIIGLMTAVVWT